jgi:hypothetical protein
LKRLNEAYSKIVWPIKAEDIIEGYKDKKFDGDLLRSLINDPTILSKEQQVSLFMGFAKDGQLDAIKQFFQNSKEIEQEKSKILQLLKKEETTDQNKTAIDSAIDMVIDSMTLKEVNFAIKTESTYNIQSKTSKKLNKKWKSLRNIKTNQTKKKKP